LGGELFLSAALHIRRLRFLVFLVGMVLHLGIEYSGFKIGLFSYFMFSIYLLVAPPRWFGRLPSAKAPPSEAGWGVLVVTLVAGAVSIGVVFPIEGVWLAVAVAAGWALLEEFPRPTATGRGRRAGVFALSCGVLLGLNMNTDVLRDYWKYRGGDTRRRGEVIQAIKAYEQVVSIDPDYAGGHARLSDLYARKSRLPEALAEARKAEKLNPKEGSYPARTARIESRLGNETAARKAARRAVKLGNKDKDIVGLAR
jgi:hypothetical protein